MKRRTKTDIVFVQFAKEKTICQDFLPKFKQYANVGKSDPMLIPWHDEYFYNSN